MGEVLTHLAAFAAGIPFGAAWLVVGALRLLIGDDEQEYSE